MEAIENKEIKGFSLKTVYTIIAGTVVTVLSIMGTFTTLSNQMTNIDNKIERNQAITDLQMKQLADRVTILENSKHGQ